MACHSTHVLLSWLTSVAKRRHTRQSMTTVWHIRMEVSENSPYWKASKQDQQVSVAIVEAFFTLHRNL